MVHRDARCPVMLRESGETMQEEPGTLLRCQHGRRPWTVGARQSLPKNKCPKCVACVLRLPSNGLVVFVFLLS